MQRRADNIASVGPTPHPRRGTSETRHAQPRPQKYTTLHHHTHHAPKRQVAMEAREHCMRRLQTLDQELSLGAADQSLETSTTPALEQVGRLQNVSLPINKTRPLRAVSGPSRRLMKVSAVSSTKTENCYHRTSKYFIFRTRIADGVGGSRHLTDLILAFLAGSL